MGVWRRFIDWGRGVPIQQPPPPWLTLLVLGPAFFGLADGCLRRTVQQPPPTARPSPPLMDRSTDLPSHKQVCVPSEIAQTRCLNGGTCFAIVLNNGVRDIGCSCVPDFRGLHCEYFNIDPSIFAVQQENLRTANIAAGVSVCILIVFFVLLSVYVYLRMRLRNRRDAEAAAAGVVQNGACADDVDSCNNNPCRDKESRSDSSLLSTDAHPRNSKVVLTMSDDYELVPPPATAAAASQLTSAIL